MKTKNPRLRLFRSQDDEMELEVPVEPTAAVRLGDLLPLLSLAQKLNFIWLKDFLDDEVKISQDLFEVLETFRGNKPSVG